MALSYMRLFSRRNLDIRSLSNIYTSSSLNTAVHKPLLASSAVCESHDEKNLRLKRPMSPHLTVYKFQLPANMSITHRATGIVLATYAMTLGIGTLIIPGGVPALIAGVDAWCLPIPVLWMCKYFLALPATYHFFNGIRHLLWDLGMFLSIKDVYKTGYTVVALAILSGITIASL